MTTTMTGLEFKRFYRDGKYWPESGHTLLDDDLLLVDGRAFPSGQEPGEISDAAVVEIHSGWVDNIPANVANGESNMSLEDYFLDWLTGQTTATLVVECPRDHLWRVILAVKEAGGSVPREVEQVATQMRTGR
ncbi:hypothetical protein [Burkholderia ambifaria]|uniref:hypothetical protein n=1 Tax=Burkholderia ambifaria TaxID=152480 RepID=UPI000F801C49|nr:hypothetical protein [Burkholderia ambifaria]